MLSARDQENLVHAHQTAGAGKQLNQGMRQLQPKTPGNKNSKTPFKKPLNDENNPLVFKAQKPGQKNGAKGNENVLHTGGVKLDTNAFVTPMGPKMRAPLGMKTTNAKAQAFKTPAPPLGTIRANRPSTGRKSKITVAQSEPVESDILSKEAEEDVPDIEYMPPKAIPLPDPPEDVEYDETYPQFKGANLYRGWAELHAPEVGEDGLTDALRKEKEKWARFDKGFDEMWLKELETEDGDINTVYERFTKKFAGAKEPKAANPPTAKARGAAAALSQQKTASNLAKPTAASAAKTKPISSLTVPKKKLLQASNPGAARHAAAVASSNTSMGYAKGRNVSRALQPSTFKQQEMPAQRSQKNGMGLENEMQRMTFLDEMLSETTDNEPLQEPLFENEGDDDFQLPMP